MKTPPVIQALFAVMLLGIVNVQMKGGALASLEPRHWFFLAVALIGSGMMVTPLMQIGKDEAPPETPTQRPDYRPDDDIDLSA